MYSTQISTHIWKLGIWLILPIQVWVVKEEDGLTLIDTGIAPMARGILRFIRELNAGPLKQIMLTHAHPDHIGALEKIRQAFPVPVYLHAEEQAYAEGRLPYPRRKKAQTLIQPGTVTALKELETGTDHRHAEREYLEGVKALAPHGALIPYHTPGHSPGHVAYYHKQDRVLIGGDLFITGKHKLRRPIPMYTSDMGQAIQSAKILQALKPDLLTVCHGRDLQQPEQYYPAYLNKWGNIGEDNEPLTF